MAAPSVLHVINNLPIGGAERFAVILAAAQMRRGWHVEVCALAEPNPLAAELARRGIPFHSLGRERLNDPRLLFDLRRLFRSTRPDVVHTHLFYADTFGRIAARFAGIQAVVGTEHSTEGARLSRRRRTAMLWTANSADRVVAVSEAVRSAAATRLGIEPGRIRVVPNGIELEPWQRAQPLAAADLGVPEDAIRVGTVGRLDAPKGIDLLIDAVSQLENRRVHLLVAGDGPLREALEARARDRGLEDRVHWLGWRDDVPRVLASLHVFAMPSRWEGHSMALLEAMASGRACVVSEIAELRSVIGTAGEHADAGDAVAFAAALQRLIDDPGRRAALGRAAQAVAAPYSIDASAASYVTIYEEILGATDLA